MSTYGIPQFFHQLGDKDQTRCYEMLKLNHGEGVIISPKDLTRDGWGDDLIDRWVTKYQSTGAEILLDPQGYSPSQYSNSTIQANDTRSLLDPRLSGPFITQSLERQKQLNVAHYVIPAPTASNFNSDWLQVLRNFSIIGLDWLAKTPPRKPIYASLPVHKSDIRITDNRDSLLSEVVDYEVDGFYLVVGDVERETDDISLISNLLETIFWLKNHGFKVILGFSSAWAIMGFPFGLDGFASSGRKNRRSFDQTPWHKGIWAQGHPIKRPDYYDYWNSHSFSTLRFPDDAEFLFWSGIWKQFDTGSPYAPPFDRQPTLVKASGEWSETSSSNHYSWEMWNLTKQFDGLVREKRVELVKKKLNTAISTARDLVNIIPRVNDRHLQAWSQGFETAISNLGIDFLEEFD